MNDFLKVIEQAKDMQNKMKETQESIKKIEVEGVAGGGSVKVHLNGDGELIKLYISTEIMKENKEILEDLALLTNSQIIDENLGDDLNTIQVDYLGTCSKVTTEEHQSIIQIEGVNEEVEEIISNIKEKLTKKLNYVLRISI